MSERMLNQKSEGVKDIPSMSERMFADLKDECLQPHKKDFNQMSERMWKIVISIL